MAFPRGVVAAAVPAILTHIVSTSVRPGRDMQALTRLAPGVNLLQILQGGESVESA